MSDELSRINPGLGEPVPVKRELDRLMDLIKNQEVPERLLFLARRLQLELNGKK